MADKRSAHPDCRNASNPYHECNEKCLKLSATCRKASNPYHECSESCLKNVAEVQKSVNQNNTAMTGKDKQRESSLSNCPFFSERKSGHYIPWNSKMDRLLGNVLIGQMARGNKCESGTWTPQALQAALDFMNSLLHLNLTNDDIQKRIGQWKKYYTVVMDVKKQSGLTWDEDQKMIIVTSKEKDKWTTYVKSHPDADGMQNRVIKNWEDIVFLYGNEGASAEDARTSNRGVEATGARGKEVDKYAIFGSPSKPSTLPCHEPNSQKETRKDALVDALIDAATSIKEYFESKKKKEMRQPTGTEIHQMVSKLPGLTPFEVFEAVQKLMNGNPEQFFLLKSLPDEEREKWIQYFMLS